MRHIIAGTAGHIDHGKSALVRALTGQETDRLEEEKRRGISIDIGFAHLDLPGARLGFVDVPGHERFVKNMLAGASGIDLVLLVIAADESIKPQTREHFDICRLLGIRAGAIVLTKADLVDPDLIELVKLEAEDLVRGSFLEGAPVCAVSSKTGQGLDELRSVLAVLASRTPEKDASLDFRLPIDRSFSMRGFGTVVTGTLQAGSVRIDDELEAHPGGVRCRVRGIQVHGQSADRARAGERTALNLAGVEAADLRRGMVLAPAGLFQATQVFDARLRLLGSAPPVKHRAPVHVHAGAAELEGEIRMLGGLSPLEAGQSGFVRIRLREPALVLPGDRFVVRKFSPVITIGGGEVLDAAPPLRRKRAEAAARLTVLESGKFVEKLDLLVRESRHGMSIDAARSRTGWRESEIEDAAGDPGFVWVREHRWLLSRKWCESTAAEIAAAVREFHKKNPLQAGTKKEEIRSRHLPDSPQFLLEALLADARELVAEGELVRLRTHRVALQEEEEKAAANMEALFRDAGLAVPATAEVLARSGVDPGRARTLLQMLLKQRRLVRVGEELVYHQTAIVRLKELLAPRRGQRFGVPEFKDWTGISRKYAIPLLEFLDRERVTRRDGDQRVVL
ncbi:MAG: selenocysteine-specific translation elongation factor [Bryobacteraceae bacterium]|nr:selenocysteine-specific translation elongation factor [Bryobacteraceae bacterium]